MVKDNRTSNQKLLVTRDDKRSKEVCRRLQCMPKKQEPYRGPHRKTYAKCSTKKALDSYHSRFCYKVTASLRV